MHCRYGWGSSMGGEPCQGPKQSITMPHLTCSLPVCVPCFGCLLQAVIPSGLLAASEGLVMVSLNTWGSGWGALCFFPLEGTTFSPKESRALQSVLSLALTNLICPSQNLISKGSKVNLFVYKRCSLKRMGWDHISDPCQCGVMAFVLEIHLCCCNKPGVGYWVLSYHHFNSNTYSYVLCSKIREKNIWQTKPLPNKCCSLALISHSGYWKQMFWCYWDLDMFVFSLLGQLKLVVFRVIPDERCFESQII